MASKDVSGKYWLQFNDTSYICSQCNEVIGDGEKIFIDGTGFFHQKKSLLEVADICLYHYNCIIGGGQDDQGELTQDDFR